MYKSFLILVFLLQFGSYSNHVAAQATTDKSQPQRNVKNPKNPISSVSLLMPTPRERAVQAEKLYTEGVKLREAGELSQASENLQQAIRLDPDFADAYAALGRTYFKMREWQKAVDNLRRAAELNTKQRAAQDGRHEKLSMSNREEATSAANVTAQIKLPQQPDPSLASVKAVSPPLETARQGNERKQTSIPVKTTPSQNKPAQLTNANAAAVRPLRPEPEIMRQPEPRKEANTAAKGAETSPQIKVPQQTNANAANLKAVSSESETTRKPPQREEAKTTATAISTSQPPQLTNTNAAAVRPLLPEPEITRQPEQRKETNTAAKGAETSPQIKVPQQTNANAANLKAVSSESETTRKPPQQEEAKTTTTSQPPQVTNANAAAMKPLRSESETTAQPEREAKSTATATPTIPQINPPQQANTNDAAVKPVQAESEATRQQEKDPRAVPSAKSVDNTALEQEKEPLGASVAMNVTPASTPLKTKSPSPISIKGSSDEVSLTKIYRVGPNDVLHVQINDSQSPKSTLFTVTSSGLLEHPMLTEPLLVTGFTVEEIGTRIENDLQKQALTDDPKVVVGVRDYASHTIVVSGLVKDSGTKFLRREGVPLYVVVADAQPLPEAASVTVVRNELNQLYEIDLAQAADMNLLVRPGDVITLLPNVTQFVYVGGEVKFPGEKTFRRGLTLTQTILTAGGATPKSKLAEIARDDGHGFLVGTRFSLIDIESGKAADPLLKPGDRITILR
jgi:protein involved in polysaccharide export with SLBB domain/tetratricopeptide (TPR) repeat protein